MNREELIEKLAKIGARPYQWADPLGRASVTEMLGKIPSVVSSDPEIMEALKAAVEAVAGQTIDAHTDEDNPDFDVWGAWCNEEFEADFSEITTLLWMFSEK